MDPMTPKATGRTRLKPIQVRTGLFRKKQVVVHQTEFQGFVPELCGNHVDGTTRKWWVDTKPEWLLEGRTVTENP
jgi:hypothetical protein